MNRRFCRHVAALHAELNKKEGRNYMKFRWKSSLATCLVAGMLLASTPVQVAAAGLAVTNMAGGLTASDLVTALVGPGVSVSNISLSAHALSAGTFTGGSAAVGFEEGVILSTGQAGQVVGNHSFGASTNMGQGGDAELTGLVSRPTYDATVLEFDFVPDADTIHWQYVFSSEEYNEWVGSSFNDVFGFFLNGTNVALVPGSSAIVSVNSINNGSNASYYVDNAAGVRPTAMDGLTMVLTISAPVNNGATNHIKLAIADAGDAIVDSNVFIKKGSFSTTPPPCTMTPSLTFESTTPTTVAAGHSFPIDFRWMTCTGSTFDSSVTIRVRNSANNVLIAGFTYGYDISYNPATGVYSQPFDTARYALLPGTRLKVMVYFNGKLRGTHFVELT